MEYLAAIQPRVAEMVLIAALSGLRWGELVALRKPEDVDSRRNKIRIARSLYRRIPKTPKTEWSVGDVDVSPTVRRILQAVHREGYVFSADGQTPIGSSTWIKRQWRKAQVAVGIRRPIPWRDLRHEFVTLLIAAGKHPKYIAKQARHHRQTSAWTATGTCSRRSPSGRSECHRERRSRPHAIEAGHQPCVCGGPGQLDGRLAEQGEPGQTPSAREWGSKGLGVERLEPLAQPFVGVEQ